jgi:alkylhydroperoxidase/carboxymuconolactone decarboxylase family protein YurZ
MGFVDWTRGELLEIVIQILFFSGVPNALNGLKIVKEVLRKEITKE